MGYTLKKATNFTVDYAVEPTIAVADECVSLEKNMRVGDNQKTCCLTVVNTPIHHPPAK